jgi:hypothetical protein
MRSISYEHVAESQHGLITAAQLARLGWSKGARRHLVDAGALVPLSGSVLKVAGSPSTLAQRRMAVVLDAGPDAALSHESAADAWGIGRARGHELHVVRSRRVTPRETHLAAVHVVRDLRPGHVVRLRGVPIATPARVVLDEAGRVGQWAPNYVERLLDRAWSKRLLNIGELSNLVTEVRRRGRSGVRLLDALVEARWQRPPAMRSQVNLSDEEGWIGCVDYLAEWAPLVVFIDGAAFHTSLTDCRHDDRQTRRLEAAGYRVERISDAEVLFDEPAVVRRLRLHVPVRDRVA